MSIMLDRQINKQHIPLRLSYENHFKSKTSADTAAITPMKINTFLSEERYTKWLIILVTWSSKL